MMSSKSSSSSFLEFGFKNSIQANGNHVDEKQPGRIIVVSNWLPLKSHRDAMTEKWCFDFDDEGGLFSQIGFDQLVYYVGLLDVDIDIDTEEQDEVCALLEEKFHCIPVFKPSKGSKELYLCFCKNYLWPLFHGMVDTTKFEFDLVWEAYKSMSYAFVEKIMHAIDDVDEDHVWINDYNLMVLPTILRKKISNLKLGFFLHVPFPSCETYQAMPEFLVEILRGLLSCDLVGFHTDYYASQFFVCCRRLFGLNNYELRSGDRVLKFNGRIISTTVITPVGISTDKNESVNSLPDSAKKVEELKAMITTPAEYEKQMHHEKHYECVTSREITCGGRKFLEVLEKVCDKNNRKRCWKVPVGFGLGSSTVLAFGPKFESLWAVDIVSAYEKSNSRLILLDCDGTLMPQGEAPSNEVLSLLNDLCSDLKNLVFIVSGRGKEILGDWFSPCKSLGLSAEHGYFTRWNGNCPWEKLPGMDFRWKERALARMTLLHENIAGSNIECKESGLVWHHEHGSTLRANELLDDLTRLLEREPVVVRKGLNIIEVEARGLGKGMVAKSLAATMEARGKQPAEFVLCIGNDQSDEEMFAAAAEDDEKQPLSMAATAQVFTCTVGFKPSMANYYLEDTNGVIRMLNAFKAAASSPGISERAAAAN